ncbi:glycosyltransferase family 4 protein [Halorarius litoreus]|uniref:glycosyltransferase family 4 protein n=1 Tax=Halorarius litoreus TaxID=2962676 RepID=UPI0020CDD134|nr:glycosyltransferase family 4 protein [Halorarius litoreus]
MSLLIVGPFQRGGVHNYIQQQIDQLSGRVAVSTHDTRVPPLGAGRLRNLRAVLTGLAAFLQFTRRDQPDLVHIHTSHRFSFYRKSLYVFFTNLVWDVPIVLHVHGSSFDEFMQTDSSVVAAIQRRVFDASDGIIVLSEYWKDVVSRQSDRSKIHVLPNAVDPETFPADPTSEPPHIVFVSNLIARKGVMDLAAAIERVAERYPGSVRVSIGGDGPLAEKIRRLEEEYDEVTYLGYLSEVDKRSLLGDGSIYVLPTYAEGLPFALLEGMAGANAVVSTSVGSIPEVIGPENGILVTPGDIDELVDAIETLVTEPERQRRMAETNRRAIERQYSWSHVIDELVEIYDSLV